MTAKHRGTVDLKRRNHKITILMTEEEASSLGLVAEREGVSRSDVVRRSLRDYPGWPGIVRES